MPNEVWNPEAIWEVRFWDRTKYIVCEVQAGDRLLAQTIAFHTLDRDGHNMAHLTFVDTERVE